MKTIKTPKIVANHKRCKEFEHILNQKPNLVLKYGISIVALTMSLLIIKGYYYIYG